MELQSWGETELFDNLMQNVVNLRTSHFPHPPCAAAGDQGLSLFRPGQTEILLVEGTWARPRSAAWSPCSPVASPVVLLGMSEGVSFHFQLKDCSSWLSSHFESASAMSFHSVSRQQVPQVKYLLDKAPFLFPRFWNTLPRFTKCSLLLLSQDLVNGGSACV